ncbi:menaquinone biosynthesis decarboxylase [uncultured Helicobacter sp.]|uniref:menaquinone biosynthesis decarboxylase n=1 Tax=uncultured Helicobacter sp. TaxID=175537 RepID=UPI00261E639C|nr:menaquinone biosynthesis decarboxylase [uncultured Helicobacter sp.]
MRQTIDKLKANNALRVISEPLDVELEIPHLAYLEVKRKDSKALLFINPVDKKRGIHYETPVLMNVFGNFKLVELLVGDVEKQASEIVKLLKLKPPRSFKEVLVLLPNLLNLRYLSPKVFKGKGLCQEVIKQGSAVDLGEIPVLKTWSEDGGRFITMGQCYTQSLDGSVRNLGMYRLQVYDKNHLGVHWQIHKDSMHLLEEYQKTGQKMPVSIAIGGDPLYTWCATAPLPYGLYELMLYGFIKKQKPKLVRCISNTLCVPYDADFVIEGFVDPKVMRDEGRFGDHTGFYTPIEPYPVMEVSAITSKKNPVYLATVVGKPPLEDKYLGYPTERIFLPLLQTTTPDLVDYYMPENGVFHNLILAKIKARFPSIAKQSMHAFWGVGQMSFVKHAIFVDENAPRLQDLEIIPYVLNRFSPKACLLSDGVCDALDHASPEFAQGGKLGVDCTQDYAKDLQECDILDDEALQEILANVFQSEVKCIRQIYTQTKNPITLIGIHKKDSITKEILETKLESHNNLAFDAIQKLQKHARIVVIVDSAKNDLENLYMLLWRVVNNIDAKRDVVILDSIVFIDATDKDKRDGYLREWPKETDCSLEVLKDLEVKGLLKDFGDLKKFYKAFHIDKSYNC